MCGSRFSLFIIILISFVVLTRMLNHSEFLYGWDSVQFALSIDDYNPSTHRPHPPGYLFYSFSLKILNGMIRNHNQTMLVFNVAATVVSCIFIGLIILHLLPKSIGSYREILAGCGSFIYATNPISWFYSSVGEIYAVEGFLVSISVYLLLRSYQNPKYFLFATAAIAISGGFRPTTELFLIPLYLAALLRRQKPHIGLSLLILVVVSSFWLFTTMVFYGGVDDFFTRGSRQFLRSATSTSPLFSESGRHTLKLLSYRLIQAITIPVLIAILLRLRKIKPTFIPHWLCLFTVAPILFFAFIHYPKDGYLLLIIPALIVISVVVLGSMYDGKTAVGILLVSSFINIVVYNQNYGNLDKSIFGETLKQFCSPNKYQIVNFNRALSGFMSTVAHLKTDRKAFIHNPEGFPDWRIVMYYFPSDEAILVSHSTSGKKKWASFAERHTSRFIHTKLLLDKSIKTVVFITTQKPSFTVNSFSVDERTYWFARRRQVPAEFEIQSFRFLKE